MKASCTDGTWKQYQSSIKRWIEYCKMRSWDVWGSNLSHYLSFFTSLFESGLGYNCINTARSAFSMVFPTIDGVRVGEHVLINRFMKGVVKLRPPRPKYSVTWDSTKLLDLLITWNNDKILLKQLTFKLAALLALITAQRSQTLAKIKISEIFWGDPVQIRISSRLKTTSLNNPNPVLVIPEYHIPSVCPVKTLRCYIDRTMSLRGASDNLFISFVSPHRPVTSQTIGHWLSKSLELAGIDTKVFTGHSFRHASTSRASAKGIHIDSIFQRAGWTNKSRVFAKHYNKPIDNRADFALSILNK